MPEELVDTRPARHFWFSMDLSSMFSVVISFSMHLELGEKIFNQVEVHQAVIMIFFFDCLVVLLVGFFWWTPPTTTYKTGAVVRMCLQMGLFYTMCLMGYLFPRLEVVCVFSALIAYGIAVAQLVYPAQDFHIGFGLLTVFGAFSMGALGISFDLVHDSVFVILICSSPVVISALLTNFPRQSANIFRKY